MCTGSPGLVRSDLTVRCERELPSDGLMGSNLFDVIRHF